MPSRLHSDLASGPSLHTIYAYITGLLLALVEIKYQGLNTGPFEQHPALMILFLMAITVYAIALFLALMTPNPVDQQNSCNLRMVLVGMGHVSGIVACELLLLVIVSPLWSFFINVSSLVLVLILIFWYNYLFHVQPPRPDTQSAEEQGTEMTDLEAAITPST